MQTNTYRNKLATAENADCNYGPDAESKSSDKLPSVAIFGGDDRGKFFDKYHKFSLFRNNELRG